MHRRTIAVSTRSLRPRIPVPFQAAFDTVDVPYLRGRIRCPPVGCLPRIACTTDAYATVFSALNAGVTTGTSDSTVAAAVLKILLRTWHWVKLVHHFVPLDEFGKILGREGISFPECLWRKKLPLQRGECLSARTIGEKRLLPNSGEACGSLAHFEQQAIPIHIPAWSRSAG